MKRVLVLGLILTGCVSMSPQAAVVRVVKAPSELHGCEALGLVSRTETVWGILGAQANNERALKADTAALGGNTLLVRQVRESLTEGPRMIGEAYRCH